MKNIPPKILPLFREHLRDSNIDEPYFKFFEKWLRYYLDYCSKYGNKDSSPESLGVFLEKLKQKGQSVAYRKQAEQAVRVYFDLNADAASIEEEEGVSEDDKGGNLSGDNGGGSVRDNSLDGAYRGDSWETTMSHLKTEIKLRQYSPKTLEAYTSWVSRFGWYSGAPRGEDISVDMAKNFLSYLAVKKKVSAATQNQAFNALLFLFRNVLKRDFDLGKDVMRAKTTKYIPTVLTHEEMEQVLGLLKFPFSLVVSVLYGCGLRLSECMNLRMNCLDFDQDLVIVHDGKGKKDRSVPMPAKIKSELEAQVKRVERLLESDLLNSNFGGVFLPASIARKSKRAGKEFQWQWLFPAKMLTYVEAEGIYLRYHNHDAYVGRAIREAVAQAKIPKRVTAHTFRHTFASHLLQANVDLRTIQQLLGHSDIRTTMIYTHTVKSRTKKEMVSPLDL